MANENETVEQVCEVLRKYPKAEVCDGSGLTVLNNNKIADRILAAHKREVAAKDAEIAELREHLREAVRLHCDNLDGDCLHCIRCGVCNYLKWRKALEGANNDK